MWHAYSYFFVCFSGSSSNFECKEEGFFADPQDCTKFYRCVDNGESSKLTKYEFECGPGTAFSEETKTCVHPADTGNPDCAAKYNEVDSNSQNENQNWNQNESQNQNNNENQPPPPPPTQTTSTTSATTTTTASSSSQGTKCTQGNLHIGLIGD